MRMRRVSPSRRKAVIIFSSSREIYGDDIYLKTAKSSSAQLLMISQQLARSPASPLAVSTTYSNAPPSPPLTYYSSPSVYIYIYI